MSILIIEQLVVLKCNEVMIDALKKLQLQALKKCNLNLTASLNDLLLAVPTILKAFPGVSGV
jgi:hypothetical protein